MTHRSTWKKSERDVASLFTEALNTVAEYAMECKRNILSGANNRRDDGRPRPGDVVLPDAYDVLVEVKYRATHAHQTLLDAAEADAAKHKLTHTILLTKTKRQQGFTAVMDADLLFALLAIPEARELLKKPRKVPRDVKPAPRRVRTPKRVPPRADQDG